MDNGFKPQRGKFTHFADGLGVPIGKRFKPQRGKFTPRNTGKKKPRSGVSNPNGVNLHATAQNRLEPFS